MDEALEGSGRKDRGTIKLEGWDWLALVAIVKSTGDVSSVPHTHYGYGGRLQQLC